MMYTILGATGNIGSVVAKRLLEKGEKVRVLARSAAKLQPFAQRGAEAVACDMNDVAALTKALEGARAAFLMIPPGMTAQDYEADQARATEAITEAVKGSGLQYAVNLSSIGGQAPSGTGPIGGAHRQEEKLNKIEKLHVMHLRPAYFMENHLAGIGLIQMMGIYGGAIKADLKMQQIATQDVGEYAAERLLKLDFNGKQTQELYGERDLTMSEVATAIGKGIGKPDLHYAQFPYDQVEQVLKQMGSSTKTAAYMIEMLRGINDGIVVGTQPRNAGNTTPTSIETFVKEVFAPAYLGKAVGA